jgi:hypothetical protein
MPFDASSRPNCATVGEKVAKLSEFIVGDLESRTLHGLQAPECYLLLARSPGSPVAQALRANAGGLAAANVSVRAIFCESEPVAAGAETLPFGLAGEVRIARDPRLLAAHEQLVLAADRVWIGDCMRREPSKRDTYERFAANAPDAAMLAVRSFERLWRAAAPLRAIPQVPAALASQLPGLSGDPFARIENPRRQ